MNEMKKKEQTNKLTERQIKEILSQDIQIPDMVQERILSTYRQLPAKRSRRPGQIRAAAAILALLCLALPAAAYASAKTGFFQAMFGNSTKESHDVIHKMVDNGKGGQTAVTIPSEEYVPVDDAQAEEMLGPWTMEEPIEKKINSHTLSIKNFVYDKNGALMYFTLEKEGGVTALAGDQETNLGKGAFFTEASDFYFTWEIADDIYGCADIYVDTVQSTPDKMYCSAYILWAGTPKDGDRPQLVLYTYPCPRGELTEETDYSTEKIPLTDKDPLPLTDIDQGEEGSLSYSPISLSVDMAKGFSLTEEEAQDPYNLKKLEILYKDGSRYVISDQRENVENSGYTLGSETFYKVLFNRLVNVNEIQEIIVNNVHFQPADQNISE